MLSYNYETIMYVYPKIGYACTVSNSNIVPEHCHINFRYNNRQGYLNVPTF